MSDTTDQPHPALKAMMMPRDTNPYGTIFGGVLLSYIDQHPEVVKRMLDKLEASRALQPPDGIPPLQLSGGPVPSPQGVTNPRDLTPTRVSHRPH